MEKNQIQSFEEFWPIYLQLHSKRMTKRLHSIGLIAGILFFIVGIATATWFLLGLSILSGYGFAWVSHFLIEKNRPAAWSHPWWSFLADFKMAYLVFTKKL